MLKRLCCLICSALFLHDTFFIYKTAICSVIYQEHLYKSRCLRNVFGMFWLVFWVLPAESQL